MRTNSSCASLVAAAVAAIIASGKVDAQATAESTEASPPQEALGLEDVIVTAQKREQRQQDVPLAVTAVTGATLENQQINDTINLVKAVPSLTFQAGNNPSNNSFRIRGVGTSLFSLGVEPSVSVVVDGVVQSRQSQNFTDFADIERVEVLRGPQGTLFGKNATAGVINIITARPTRDLLIKSSLTAAQDDEYRASGTLSGPITDTLRARLNVFYNDVGGYHTNAANGRDEGDSKGKGA